MQPKANQDLRREAKDAGVILWRIADELGCSEPTLIRNWRHELSDEEKARVRKIISRLSTKEVLCNAEQ